MTISEGGGRGHCRCLSWFMGNGITEIHFWFSLRGNRSKVSFTHSVFTSLFFHSPKRETVVCESLPFPSPSAELWLVNFPKPRRKRGKGEEESKTLVLLCSGWLEAKNSSIFRGAK